MIPIYSTYAIPKSYPFLPKTYISEKFEVK